MRAGKVVDRLARTRRLHWYMGRTLRRSVRSVLNPPHFPRHVRAGSNGHCKSQPLLRTQPRLAPDLISMLERTKQILEWLDAERDTQLCCG